MLGMSREAMKGWKDKLRGDKAALRHWQGWGELSEWGVSVEWESLKGWGQGVPEGVQVKLGKQGALMGDKGRRWRPGGGALYGKEELEEPFRDRELESKVEPEWESVGELACLRDWGEGRGLGKQRPTVGA